MTTVLEGSLEAGFLRAMGNHLVALAAKVAKVDAGGESHGFLWYSGFVIRIHGQNYWTTAGHCIEKYEKEMRKTDRRVYGNSFMDCFGTSAAHAETLPFTYEIGDAIRIPPTKLDFDFAILALSDLVCMGLAKNGVKAVTREMWLDRPERNYFDYKVFGLPRHGAEQMSDLPSWGLRPVAVGVERLDELEVTGCPHHGWFIGRLKADADSFESPVGMSGGPIFAFYKDENGETRYDIIAVQSSWLPDDRIIFGCPLSLFAEVIHQEIEELKGG